MDGPQNIKNQIVKKQHNWQIHSDNKKQTGIETFIIHHLLNQGILKA